MSSCEAHISRWIRQKGESIKMMGVLNCTPDSFSDGGQYMDIDAAVEHGLAMQAAGASIVDVGGESTRPNAQTVTAEEELRRVIPVIQKLVEQDCPVSIDTMKSDVMEHAVKAGACMINDVSALSFDAESLAVAAACDVDICLMHMQGQPQNMQQNPCYTDVVSTVIEFFEQRVECCLQAGIKQSLLILDPGIGFGKRLQDNLQLIANLDVLRTHFGMPILLGVSRKSFIGKVTGSEVENRELETAVSGAIGIFQGADMLRIHDVGGQKKACDIATALADAKLS